MVFIFEMRNRNKRCVLLLILVTTLVVWMVSQVNLDYKSETGFVNTFDEEEFNYSTSAVLDTRLGQLAYRFDAKLTNAKPPSAAIVGERLFFKRPLVIWAAEWHMTPIKDLRNILEPFGVRFLDYNLDPWRCEWHDCKMKEKLRVLTSDNVLNIDPPIPSRFYEAYKDDPEMKRVDVIFCGYPASLCEMFEPFNKSVLILASTR